MRRWATSELFAKLRTGVHPLLRVKEPLGKKRDKQRHAQNCNQNSLDTANHQLFDHFRWSIPYFEVPAGFVGVDS